MVVNKQVLSDLKAILFELTYSLDTYSRKEIMEKLCGDLKVLLKADHVVCYMYNKWNLDEQITTYSTQQKKDTLRQHSHGQFCEQDFNEKEKIQIVENKTSSNIVTYIFKLNCSDQSNGLLYLTFKKGSVIDQSILLDIKKNVEQFIQVLYHNRHQKFLEHRSNLLFHLSTELHAVHQTTEVLNSMHKTAQKLYPHFTFTLLMSKEYDDADVPIQLIEYSSEESQSGGTLAFIKNEIQILSVIEKNETQVFSPLSGKQGVYGVVKITIPQIVRETELELDLIEKFSNMVGGAIERTTLFQSSNQQVSDLQIINTASHELNLNLEQSEIIHTVKKYILETSQAKEIGVIIYGELEEGIGGKFDVLNGSTDYFFSENGRDLLMHLIAKLKANSNAILSGNFKLNGTTLPLKSLMVIPMWDAEAIFGFIVTAHPSAYHFTFDKFKFIQSFIQHASLAFKNSVLKEQLRIMATTDYLTKLYTRNYLDKMIGKSMEKDTFGTFVLFDVDDFKQINDTFGHYIGDKVLIQVADIIKKEMKQNVIAARWGGEEFALYFPNLSITDTIKRVDNIRKAVLTETNPNVSLSCGVSEWSSDFDTDSIEKLFIRADEALYEAKSTGKNRIIQKCSLTRN